MKLMKVVFIFFILNGHLAFASTKDELAKMVSSCAQKTDNFQTFNVLDIPITTNDSHIILHLKLHFRYYNFWGQYQSKKDHGKNLVQNTFVEINNFLKEYNLIIKPILSHDQTEDYYPAPVPKNAKLIYLYPEQNGSMNIMRWGVNFGWDYKSRAKIYLHEIIHLWGPYDEYERAQGPSAGEPDSFEEDSILKHWNHPDARLYPRHIIDILKALGCN